MARRKLTAAKFINVDRRVDPHEARQRIAERDARAALDTRTPAQVWLGEPPPGRSGTGASICGDDEEKPARKRVTGRKVREDQL